MRFFKEARINKDLVIVIEIGPWGSRSVNVERSGGTWKVLSTDNVNPPEHLSGFKSRSNAIDWAKEYLISTRNGIKEHSTKYTSEDATKIDQCLELLIEVVELFPDAQKHVQKYIKHWEIHNFRESLKDK